MREAILRGMARAFFGDAWASWMDEYGGGVGAGTQILDAMPQELDPAAITAAANLADRMEAENKMPVEALYVLAPAGLDADTWGHYAAMQAMGHGVGLWEYDDAYQRGGRWVVPWQEFGYFQLDPEKFPT